MKDKPKFFKTIDWDKTKFSFLRGTKYVYKRLRCPYCRVEITTDRVRHLPSFEIRLYCGKHECLLKYLKEKGYETTE